MTLQEAYLFLLTDSFMSSLIFPIQTNLVFPVMKIFGGYNPVYMALIATLGSLLGVLANWAIGLAIATTLKYQPAIDRAKKFVNFLYKNAIWLTLLIWVPILGSIIAVGLGVVDVRLNKLISISLFVHLFYFCLLAYTLNPI